MVAATIAGTSAMTTRNMIFRVVMALRTWGDGETVNNDDIVSHPPYFLMLFI